MDIFNIKILISLLKYYWGIKTKTFVIIYIIMIVLSLFLSIFFVIDIEKTFKLQEFLVKNFILIQGIFFLFFFIFPGFLFFKKYIYESGIGISFLNIERVKKHLFYLDFKKEKLAGSYNIQFFLFFQQLLLYLLIIIFPFILKIIISTVFLLQFFIYYFLLIFYIIILIMNIYGTIRCYNDYKK